LDRLHRLLAGATSILATAGLAAPAYAASVDQLAREAYLNLCPGLLELETPLADEESIKSRGYVAEASREHPRMGTLDVVGKDADDGRVWIANSRDASVCQVGLEGSGARAAFEALLASPHLTLVPDGAAKTPNPQTKLTQFRTPAIDGVYLGVQFFDVASINPTAPLIIQQYLLEEE
jgi:hypothetical protein